MLAFHFQHVKVRCLEERMDSLKRLEKLMARLRSKGGCPWDRRQTHKSLRPYLLEEAHEVLDAIDGGDPRHLREELGDLLLQVVFHAQMARERGQFNLQDVARTIGDKLVRRHPHVFGKSSRKISDINRKWEELKRREKPERKSALDGLPVSLSSLLRAQRMQDKMGPQPFFPKTAAEVEAKIGSEWKRLKKAGRKKSARNLEETLGSLLFNLALLANFRGTNAEMSLRKTNRRIGRQFQRLEKTSQKPKA
jgi:tetrapyrrole methylase family protein/MazG family protein